MDFARKMEARFARKKNTLHFADNKRVSRIRNENIFLAKRKKYQEAPLLILTNPGWPAHILEYENGARSARNGWRFCT